MKRRIGLILAVILIVSLVTGTVAFAAGNGENSQQPQEPQQTGQGNTFWEDIRPLIQQAKANREQIRTLNLELTTLHYEAKAHLGELRENPDAITEEQIEQVQTLIASVIQCRTALQATGPEMVQYRQSYRNAMQNRNRENIEEALGSIIMIQEERLDCIREMIALNEQICDI